MAMAEQACLTGRPWQPPAADADAGAIADLARRFILRGLHIREEVNDFAGGDVASHHRTAPQSPAYTAERSGHVGVQPRAWPPNRERYGTWPD